MGHGWGYVAMVAVAIGGLFVVLLVWYIGPWLAPGPRRRQRSRRVS